MTKMINVVSNNGYKELVARFEVIANASTAVESRTVVSNLAKRILANNQVSIYSVIFHKDGEVELMRTPMPESRFSREAIREKDILVREEGGVWVSSKADDRDPFTKDRISVVIEDLEYLHLATNRIGINYADKETSVWLEGPNGGWYNANEPLQTAPDITLFRGFRIYDFLMFSASGIRNIQAVMDDVTRGDTRAEKLDRWMFGAYAKKVGKEVDIAGLIKGVGRFGQVLAGSVDLGALPGYIYYAGTFGSQYENSHDGAGYFLENFVSMCVSVKTGRHIAPIAVRGMGLQSRIATSKFFGITISKEAADAIVANLDPDKITIVGDPNNIAAILDANCVKMDYDMDREVGFEVLDMARRSGARLSKQIIEKMLYANAEKTEEFLMKRFEEQVLGEVKNLVFNDEASIPTPEEVDNGYLNDLVSKVAPGYIRKSPAMFRSAIRNTIQRHVKGVIDRLNIEIKDGGFMRLTPDVADLVAPGVNVLAHDEVYIKMPRGSKAAKSFMGKYPTMGIKEFGYFKVVRLADIRKRLKKLLAVGKINQAQFDAIMSFYESIGEGIAVLPAVDIVKAQCAGLDYDFDGAVFFWDEELMAIFEGHVNEAVMIREPKGAKAAAVDGELNKKIVKLSEMANGKLTFDVKFFAMAFRKQVANGNMSIGEITYINNNIVALLELPRDEFMYYGKLALVENITGVGCGAEKYVGIPMNQYEDTGIETYEVWQGLALKVVEWIRNADLDDYENLVHIYLDLNRLYRMYQELTIDAAKKATPVKVDVILSTVWAACLSHVTHDFEDFESEFHITRVKRPDAGKPNARKIFVDRIAAIQNKMADEYMKLINGGVKKIFAGVAFNEDDLRKISLTVKAYPEVNKALTSTVKQMYRASSAVYKNTRQMIENLEEIDVDDEYNVEPGESSKSRLVKAQERFDHECDMISNLSRQIMHGMADADAGRILVAASMTGKDGLDPKNTNQMAVTLCKDKFMAMIMADYAQVNVCGYPLLSGQDTVQVGDVLKFHNGQAGTVLVAADTNDELTVYEHMNKLYAVKPIVIDSIAADFSKALFTVRASIDPKTGMVDKAGFELMGTRMRDRIHTRSITLKRNDSFKGKEVWYSVRWNYTNDKNVDGSAVIGQFDNDAHSKIYNSLMDGVNGTVNESIRKRVIYAENKIGNLFLVELKDVTREHEVAAVIAQDVVEKFEDTEGDDLL